MTEPPESVVAVTGGTGFIGEHLVYRLICEGYRATNCGDSICM